MLTALGVNIDADFAIVRRCLWEIGIGFLMAPRHHSATRHVAPTRVELGTRTIFNLLGPLSNPAKAPRQLVGVFAPEWVRPMAEVLGRLGSERAWVVHGSGLDELTTAGRDHGRRARRTARSKRSRSRPRMSACRAARLEDLRGGEPEHNARLMRDLLGGSRRAAARCRAAQQRRGACSSPDAPRLSRHGIELAARSLDSGAARRVLERLVASHQRASEAAVAQ